MVLLNVTLSCNLTKMKKMIFIFNGYAFIKHVSSHEKIVFFSNIKEKHASRAARWTQLCFCGHQS